MKFRILFLLTGALMIVGCFNPERSTNINVSSKDAAVNATAQPSIEKQMAFRELLQKFKMLSLPLYLGDSMMQSTDGLQKISNPDTLFIATEYPDETICYGLLPDTAQMYQLIWLMPYAEYVPVLTTFTKKGEKIGQKQLSVGECGSDCCFTCKEFVIIDKDLSFYSADSIKSCTCDSTGAPIESTMKEYVRYFTGKILPDGKIYATDVAEKAIGK